MKNIFQKIVLLSIGVLLAGCSVAGIRTEIPDTDPVNPISIQTNGRMLTISSFHSTILNNSRTVKVYLPLSYTGSTNHYPVLYMHDGQNVFAPGGPYGSWDLEVSYDALVAADQIHEIIIVAVDNTSARMSEYTPDVDSSYGGGNGDAYLRFLTEELKPFIDTHFQSLSDAPNTAVMGSSLGGLISFYAALHYSHIFGMAGCMSTSFWWNNRSMITYVSASGDLSTISRLWIDAGTAEGSDTDGNGLAYMAEDAYRVSGLLTERGLAWGSDILMDIEWGAGHNEAAWSQRVYKPLLYFFGKDQNRTVQSITPRLSSLEIDKTGVIPSLMLLTKAVYTNGLESTLLCKDLLIQSAQSNLYTYHPTNTILLNNANINSDTNITFCTTYAGLSNSVTLQVYQALSSTVSMNITVTTPLFSQSVIYMVGDNALIGGWQPTGGFVLHEKETLTDTKVFTNTLQLPRNTSLSFKFLSGTGWNYEELTSGGSPIANRVYTVTSSVNNYNATVVRWKSTP